jgi:predicted hydrocarbon binding protein
VHGLIFSGLRDYTTFRLGDERTAELWSDRVFEPDETYDDEWFVAQLKRVGRATGESLDEVQRGFGSFAAQETFVRLFPTYYEKSGDTLTFLLGIEETIHDVVRATIVGAYPPKLHVQPLRDVGVLVSYTSERKLCPLLEGLVRGTAEHYGDKVVVEEIQCMHRGDPGCVFTVVRAQE